MIRICKYDDLPAEYKAKVENTDDLYAVMIVPKECEEMVDDMIDHEAFLNWDLSGSVLDDGTTLFSMLKLFE